MKLAKIQATLDSYLNKPESLDDLRRIISSIKQLKANWTFESPNFPDMFNQSIDDSIFRVFYPERDLPFKKVMLEMIKRNPIAIKQMFLDLFYDRVDLRSRVEHFILECDENFKKLSHEITPPHGNHLHQDFRAISIYLFLKDPEKYSYVDYPILKSYLQNIEARNIPDTYDFENQIKAISIISNITTREVEKRGEISDIDFNFINTNILGSALIQNFKST